MPKYRTTIEFRAENDSEAFDRLNEVEQTLREETDFDALPLWDLTSLVSLEEAAEEEDAPSSVVWFSSEEDGKVHALETPDELTEADTPYADQEAVCGTSGPWNHRSASDEVCEECAG